MFNAFFGFARRDYVMGRLRDVKTKRTRKVGEWRLAHSRPRISVWEAGVSSSKPGVPEPFEPKGEQFAQLPTNSLGLCLDLLRPC